LPRSTNQKRIVPGGSLTTPDSIFVTTRRIVFENPKWLGMKKELIDFMFKDLANVKINKGIFSSEIELSPRFNSDKLLLPAVSKGVAEGLFSMIRKGISGDLEDTNERYSKDTVQQRPKVQPEDVLAKLERFAALKEKGIISEEEFQAIKKKLLGDMIGIDTGPQKIIIPP
jgi:hypothetical protein